MWEGEEEAREVRGKQENLASSKPRQEHVSNNEGRSSVLDPSGQWREMRTVKCSLNLGTF